MSADEEWKENNFQVVFLPSHPFGLSLPDEAVAFAPSTLNSYDIDNDFFSSDGKQGGGSSDSGTDNSDTDGLTGDDCLGSISQMEVDQNEITSFHCNGTLQNSLCKSASSVSKQVHHCPICPFSCEETEPFVLHLQTSHSDQVNLTCKTCSQSFSLQEIHAHVLRCKGSHTCPHCKSTFAQRAHLQRHISRTHFSNDSCVCDICGRVLSSKSNLKQHKKQHEGDYSHKCKFCGTEFFQYFHLQLHIDSHHADMELGSEPKPHECAKCGRAFIFDVSLKHHMRQHLKSEKKKTHQCGQCDKTFPHLSQLERHELTHSGPEARPLHCSKCPRSFNRRHMLLDHELWHQDERAFSCPECHQAYASSEYLRNHFRKHFATTSTSSLNQVEASAMTGVEDGQGCTSTTGCSMEEGLCFATDRELTRAIMDKVGVVLGSSCGSSSSSSGWAGSGPETLDLDLLNDYLTDKTAGSDVFLPCGKPACSSSASSHSI